MNFMEVNNMDLGAFANIENLEELLEKNNIDIPRLRGLRLMSEEKPITEEELQQSINFNWLSECVDLCCCDFNLNAEWVEWSDRTTRISEKYIEFHVEEDGRINHCMPVGIKWDKVHGDKRKAFKHKRRKVEKRVREQFAIWNKYCGREDVLYIHCRLGGGNWKYYDCDNIIKNQDWCLDYVEDAFDCTYLDVFAKI